MDTIDDDVDTLGLAKHFQIAKISPKPGDILVFKSSINVPAADRRRIADYLESILPSGVKGIILDGSVSLDRVIEAAQIDHDGFEV